MIDKTEANQFLRFGRRKLLANSDGYEESLASDNLERECIEGKGSKPDDVKLIPTIHLPDSEDF